MDAFDYWGMLERLAGGLRKYAEEKQLFELRGKKFDFGQGLLLRRTGPRILPSEFAGKLAVPYRMQGLNDAQALAFLQKAARGFPIKVAIRANFYQYDSIGGSPPAVEKDGCFYELLPGQQRHWLAFARDETSSSSHFRNAFEYMLEASHFVSICTALRDDVHDCAVAIQADEQKILPLSAAIDAFAKGISQT